MIKTRGFTLIEVLISMVILEIGLLGLATLQGISLRDNQDAYYYQQASLLAYEMQDRIRGNYEGWTSIPTASTESTCSSSPGCSATQMAATDYQHWVDSAASIFRAPATGNMVEITRAAQANTNCSSITATEVCLITHWERTNTQSSALSNTATFYLKVTP